MYAQWYSHSLKLRKRCHLNFLENDEPLVIWYLKRRNALTNGSFMTPQVFCEFVTRGYQKNVQYITSFLPPLIPVRMPDKQKFHCGWSI